MNKKEAFSFLMMHQQHQANITSFIEVLSRLGDKPHFGINVSHSKFESSAPLPVGSIHKKFLDDEWMHNQAPNADAIEINFMIINVDVEAISGGGINFYDDCLKFAVRFSGRESVLSVPYEAICAVFNNDQTLGTYLAHAYLVSSSPDQYSYFGKRMNEVRAFLGEVDEPSQPTQPVKEASVTALPVKRPNHLKVVK